MGACSSTTSLPPFSGYGFCGGERRRGGSEGQKEGGGEGDGPCVYRGIMSGLPVAVKRLGPTTADGVLRFTEDVEMAALFQHDNILPLMGYCVDGLTPLIVYEFMPQGSLHSRLTFQPCEILDGKEEEWGQHGELEKAGWEERREGEERGVLPWSVRVYIAMKTAEALAFMHQSGILHRNLKSSNILLSQDLSPKLSDFLGFSLGGAVHLSRLHGYIDPAFSSTGVWNSSTDVYTFGIILLEILTGCGATGGGGVRNGEQEERDEGEEGEEVGVVETEEEGVGERRGKGGGGEEDLLCNWTKPYLNSPFPTLGVLVDTRLGGNYCQESALAIARLARDCLDARREDRPSMDAVELELRGIWEMEMDRALETDVLGEMNALLPRSPNYGALPPSFLMQAGVR